MKKGVLTVLALLLAVLPVLAQNNSYGIDDQCYELFLEADKAIGTAQFDQLNAALLAKARETKDEKARTIYYVERLKHAVKLVPSTPASIDKAAYDREKAAIEAQAVKCFEELKVVSRETGYMQYYYYAYMQMRNYYYFDKQFGKMMELITEMRNTALAEHDDYGQWVGDKYLVNMYMAQDDFKSAKKYLPEIIAIYHSTQDPTILRQPVADCYLDYSECFPVGSDSMRFFVREAREYHMGLQDTVRCDMADAVLALLDRRIADYAYYRDKALSGGFAKRLSPTLDKFFHFADALPEGNIGKYDDQLSTLSSFREIRMLGKLAESWGQYKEAFLLEQIMSARMETKLSELNEMNLSELEARYGNNELNANLAVKTRQVERITRLVAILVGALLLLTVVFLLLYIRTIRRAWKKDEARIQELMEANEKVRLADETKTRFIQNMSHELRTPLNAITGFSQLLSLPDGMFSGEEKEEFSNHIVNNTRMLTMLLDDILHSSAMDSGTYRISIEQADCERICREALSAAEHRLQPGVKLEFSPEMELPHLFRTDPLRVQQVLTNLLTNACKHTPSGEIHLGCSLKEIPGMVSFSITDTGPGIPADQAERIFERFVKLNDFVQGTGLGLSICRDLATRLGGRVFLDTTYTGGSRFVFAVPDAQEEE